MPAQSKEAKEKYLREPRKPSVQHHQTVREAFSRIGIVGTFSVVERTKLPFMETSEPAQLIVAVAEKMLSGEIGIIEGSRQLVALASQTEFDDKEVFRIFRGIDSETDDLPTGVNRALWSEDALRLKDQQIADYEARIRGAALEACRILVNTSKRRATVEPCIPLSGEAHRD